MTRQIIILTLFILSFFTSSGQTLEDNYMNNLPKPKGWVNDFENIYTAEQIIRLDSLISNYEKITSREISVVTIPANTIEKENFDELILEIGKKWGVGKKDENNGIVIGISKGHRRIRIQNGKGIETLLSDNQTKEIIDSIFIPNFKNDKFFEGTFEGIQEIEKKLDKKNKNYYIDFNKVSVYEYLELLKVEKNNTNKLENILTIGLKTPENWLTDKDIDTLINYINSNDPAKCVMQIVSSYIPIEDSSTIGGQVLDILEAYKNKKSYPTTLTSCSKTDEKRIEEIKKWWNDYKK